MCCISLLQDVFTLFQTNRRALRELTAKAAAAEKRAQKKAGVAPAAAPAPATAWASPAQKPSNAAAPAAVVEEDITEFAPVKIQGKSYLRNCRGDLLTEEYDWVGRFENGKINTKFTKPEDLEE